MNVGQVARDEYGLFAPTEYDAEGGQEKTPGVILCSRTAGRSGILRRVSTPLVTWVPAVLVVLASIGTGTMCGGLSGWFYPHVNTLRVGLPLGGLVGLVVGVGWVGWMRRKAGAEARKIVVGWGALGGLISGSVAALVVHVGMSLCFREASWLRNQLTAQVFGLLGGTAIGLVGGIAWYVALRFAPRAGSAVA